MVEVSTPRANTLERRIVLKYDMTALFTFVPVSTSNGGHDFEVGAFDAVGAANYLDWFWHQGRAGESAQLRAIPNTLSKLQAKPITGREALYVRHRTNGRRGPVFRYKSEASSTTKDTKVHEGIRDLGVLWVSGGIKAGLGRMKIPAGRHPAHLQFVRAASGWGRGGRGGGALNNCR